MSSKRSRKEASASSASEIEDSDVESVAQAVPKPAPQSKSGISATFINNIRGLQRSIQEIKTDLPWIERMEVVSAEPFVADPSDDLRLELGL
jgi:hypothetical protein